VLFAWRQIIPRQSAGTTGFVKCTGDALRRACALRGKSALDETTRAAARSEEGTWTVNSIGPLKISATL